MDNEIKNEVTEVTEETAVTEVTTAETTEAATQKTAKPDKKKSTLKEILDFCLPIIIALVVAVGLKTFVFANAEVPTGSMLNTIQEKDRIIASRLEYNFHDPERYDIIIFRAPDEVAKGDNKTYYVKRIIGLPGETVEVKDGDVFVTDADGKTEQLRDDFVTVEEPVGDYGPYVVPEESYFVMGDNRNHSADSRMWVTTNYVHRDLIVGKVKFRYYPNFEILEEKN